MPGLVNFPLLQSGVLFVDHEATGSGNGSSWTNAYPTLSPALAAAIAGEQVWIAEGTYHPSSIGDRDESFFIDKGIGIFGGFDGTEAALGERDLLNHRTVLSGEIGLPTFADNSRHVVQIDPGSGITVELNGLTITKGYSDVGDAAGVEASSGILRMIDCQVVKNSGMGQAGVQVISADEGHEFRDCLFAMNRGQELGGALSLISTASYPLVSCTLTDCSFKSNYSGDGGGAIYFDTLCILERCRFHGNEADGWDGGGAVYSLEQSHFIDCRFVDNDSFNKGGALLLDGGRSCSVDRCYFGGNTAGLKGGAICKDKGSLTVTNSIISGNEAAYGGGLYCTDGSYWSVTVSVFNNTIVNNHAFVGGGGISIDEDWWYGGAYEYIENNILWGNYDSLGYTETSQVVNLAGEPISDLTYNTIMNLSNYPPSNLGVNPQFRQARPEDFRLSASSPMIDAGRPGVPTWLASAPFDFNKDDRILGGRIDIGADELR